jgi:FkbM family methyltransferase
MAAAEMARYFRNWLQVWQAYRRSRPIPPLQIRFGLTLNHSPTDDPIHLFREIFIEQSYARDFYQPKPEDTVIDLGANIGMLALFLQQQARGIRVHCFEPASSARRFLSENLRENRVEDLCPVYPVAVGAAGKLHLWIDRNSINTSAFLKANGDGEETDSVTLSDALRLAGSPTRIDLLKIDIEGSEIDLVQNSKPEDMARVSRVAAEFHDNLRPGACAALSEFLETNGFRILRIHRYPAGFGMLYATRLNPSEPGAG